LHLVISTQWVLVSRFLAVRSVGPVQKKNASSTQPDLVGVATLDPEAAWNSSAPDNPMSFGHSTGLVVEGMERRVRDHGHRSRRAQHRSRPFDAV